MARKAKPTTPSDKRPASPDPAPADALPMGQAVKAAADELGIPEKTANNCMYRWAKLGCFPWWTNPRRKNGKLVRPRDMVRLHRARADKQGTTGPSSKIQAEWLSNRRFAEISGLALATVASYKAEGKFTDDPTIGPEMTRRRALQVASERAEREGDSEPEQFAVEPGTRGRRPTTSSAKHKLTAIQAEKAQVELDILRETLFQADDVVLCVTSIARIVGHTMQSIATTLVGEIRTICMQTGAPLSKDAESRIVRKLQEIAERSRRQIAEAAAGLGKRPDTKTAIADKLQAPRD